MNERLWIRAGTLLTPRSACRQMLVVVSGGLIEAILPDDEGSRAAGETVLDAGDAIVAPGFVDLHVHGGGGYDTMDATPEAVSGLAAFHARHGTTSLLPTTVAAPAAQIHLALEAIAEAMVAQPAGARILGAHVEGPFLSPARRGAHLERYLRPPNWDEDGWLRAHLATIRRLTLAPELPGALEMMRALRPHGVLISLGHSTAGEELVGQAVLAGATHVTHLYNGMSSLEKIGALRQVGLAEAALSRDDLSVEIIADGWHLPPTLMRLILRLKGVAQTALVTDAMRAAGLAEGRYVLGSGNGMGVTVRGGMAITDEGGLAGSVATMDQLVRNAVRRLGLAPAEALEMATLTPARILGLGGRSGEIAVGKQADLVVLDEGLDVTATVVGGRVVYRRNGT